MATIYQVSELAGVSLSTVSRVLNNHPNVSEKTKKKVNSAMKKLGYRPNSTARSLASNRSDCVGILVGEVSGPFYSEMLAVIEGVLRQAGKYTIITAGHNEQKLEQKGIEFLADRNCDALILMPDAMSDEQLISLSQSSTPLVVLNRCIDEMQDHCFHLDNYLGGYLATKHLVEMGHKDIAYISGPLHKQDASDRLSGHKKALTEAGLSYNPELIYEGRYETKNGVEGIQSFLEKGMEFSAVACGNDDMATGAMLELEKQGINVPQDCSVIGFDNVFFSDYLSPKLTTIHFPIDDMAEMAARWILKNVYNQKDMAVKNKFTPYLIERNSTSSRAS